jgi:acyl-CoA reductase-like NAD-dependent aldehyde dehydrogenase
MAQSLTSSSAESISAPIPMLIGGEWRPAQETYDVRDPYRGDVVARAPRSSLGDLDAALSAAVAAKPKAAAIPGYERAALLRRVGVLLAERADAIAEVMTRESGKALKDARAEVIRSQDTIQLSAEEAVRIEGEHVPLEASAMARANSPSCCDFRSAWSVPSRHSTRRSIWPATRWRRRSPPATPSC